MAILAGLFANVVIWGVIAAAVTVAACWALAALLPGSAMREKAGRPDARPARKRPPTEGTRKAA